MYGTIFDEQLPGLGEQIAQSSNAPSSTTEKKWWEALIEQIPDIAGVFVPNPNTGAPAQIITQPTGTQTIFSTKNMIVAGLVVIGILVAWKLIQKM